MDTTDPGAVAAETGMVGQAHRDRREGMVVKPESNVTRRAKSPVQPGLKVRGREYLRTIYGPDYIEPANLDRLRQRSLAHKRSLAAREYALGLESEPVDPRL